MQKKDLININLNEGFINKRKHLRSTFTYPVELKLFSQKADGIFFSGYLDNISQGGAGFNIDDKYGRIDINGIKNAKIKLTLNIPRENRINIFAYIQWAKKIKGTSEIKMGIAFKDMSYNELTIIEKLIGLKSKDHNMLWNLWEQYEK